ncbi:Ribosomal protein L11 domain protein [Aphelenchoides besseyi]|nr:Ribosomal protein L11 domain protein [Aphelenchoides besseyi]
MRKSALLNTDSRSSTVGPASDTLSMEENQEVVIKPVLPRSHFSTQKTSNSRASRASSRLQPRRSFRRLLTPVKNVITRIRRSSRHIYTVNADCENAQPTDSYISFERTPSLPTIRRASLFEQKTAAPVVRVPKRVETKVDNSTIFRLVIVGVANNPLVKTFERILATSYGIEEQYIQQLIKGTKITKTDNIKFARSYKLTIYTCTSLSDLYVLSCTSVIDAGLLIYNPTDANELETIQQFVEFVAEVPKLLVAIETAYSYRNPNWQRLHRNLAERTEMQHETIKNYADPEVCIIFQSLMETGFYRRMAANLVKKGRKKDVVKVIHNTFLKTNIRAQMASAAPPLGPQLGQRGVNVANFCKEFNRNTEHIKPGVLLPTRIDIKPDRTYDLEICTPTSSWLLKRAAGITRDETAGIISVKHIYEIAKIKSKDKVLVGVPLKHICMQLIKTCNNMGIKVQYEDLDPTTLQAFLDERRDVVKAQLQAFADKKSSKNVEIDIEELGSVDYCFEYKLVWFVFCLLEVKEYA